MRRDLESVCLLTASDGPDEPPGFPATGHELGCRPPVPYALLKTLDERGEIVKGQLSGYRLAPDASRDGTEQALAAGKAA